MAFPTTMSPISFENIAIANDNPFIVGSDVYLLHHNTYDLKIAKANNGDPELGFTEQDSANRPGFPETEQWQKGSGFVRGNTIHYALQASITSGEKDTYYSTFDTTTDQWAISNERVHEPGAAIVGSLSACSCVVKSDGGVRICYIDPSEKIMGTDYNRVHIARRDAGSWTINISISGLTKTEINEQQPSLLHVDDTNDRIHCFFQRSGDSHRFSTFLDDNSFGHQDTVLNPNFGSGAYCKYSWHDGSNQKVRVDYLSATDTRTMSGFNDGDSPTPSVVASAWTDQAEGDMVAGGVDETTNIQWRAIMNFISGGESNIDIYKTGVNDDNLTLKTAGYRTGIQGPGIMKDGRVIVRNGTPRLVFLYNNLAGVAQSYDEFWFGVPIRYAQPYLRQPLIGR